MDRDPYLAEQARLQAAWAADMKWLKEMPARVEAEFRADAKKQRRLDRQSHAAQALGLPVGMMWLGMFLLAPLFVAIGFLLA
ncbi:MAG TPA: hypothetical protein VHU88_15495 [Sporichthyaceae bacterium]|jgi:hypothetical protein|nr:hypothetical protein [Sporichthyaceae bacterium]